MTKAMCGNCNVFWMWFITLYQGCLHLFMKCLDKGYYLFAPSLMFFMWQIRSSNPSSLSITVVEKNISFLTILIHEVNQSWWSVCCTVRVLIWIAGVWCSVVVALFMIFWNCNNNNNCVNDHKIALPVCR